MSEIAKFQALFQLAVLRNIDLTCEIRFQRNVLNSMGIDINSEIHNRDRRKSISIAQAEMALALVRQAAGLTGSPLKTQRSVSYEERQQTRNARTEAYLRASGK